MFFSHLCVVILYLSLFLLLKVILFPASISFSKLLSMKYSAQKSNRLDDNISPWCISFPILYQFIIPCSIPTAVSWPAYTLPWKQVRWSGILISSRIFHNMLWRSQSKGFPGGSDDKASACNGAGPFWYSSLEDPQEKEMVGYSPWVTKSDKTE